MNVAVRRIACRRLLIVASIFWGITGCNKSPSAHSDVAKFHPVERSGRVLSESDLDSLRPIAAASLSASQKDVFGHVLLKDPQFGLLSIGDLAILRIVGISPTILRCEGQGEISGGTVPFKTAVLVEFAAFELANLAPPAFSRIDDLGTLRLLFNAESTDKYGNKSPVDFFSATISRQQSAKMNWGWFRKTIFRGGFDPTAFSDFGVISQDSGKVEDVSDALEAIRATAEGAEEASGGAYSDAIVVAAAQLSNYSNCAL